MRWHLKHDWYEVGREYNPPQHDAKLRNVSETTISRAVHGFTMVEYVCRREGCGKRKAVELLGRVPGATEKGDS